MQDLDFYPYFLGSPVHRYCPGSLVVLGVEVGLCLEATWLLQPEPRTPEPKATSYTALASFRAKQT